MGQPLFLHSVMQEKIWGGTRLKEEFGYEIPSDHVGEFWAISAHPHGVSKVANGPYEGMGLDQLYQEHRELFGNRKEPVFPLLTKIWMPTIGSVYRCTQMIPMQWSMKENLEKLSVGM